MGNIDIKEDFFSQTTELTAMDLHPGDVVTTKLGGLIVVDGVFEDFILGKNHGTSKYYYMDLKPVSLYDTESLTKLGFTQHIADDEPYEYLELDHLRISFELYGEDYSIEINKVGEEFHKTLHFMKLHELQHEYYNIMNEHLHIKYE
jgi:hypothetical protein